MHSRLLAASLVALLANTAGADLRLISQRVPSTQPGTTEQRLLIDAGVEHAGRAFISLPFSEGRPQRAIARRYDALRGVLNENGRALLTLSLPPADRLSFEDIDALEAGVTHHVAVLDATGRAIERAAGGFFSFQASTSQNILVSSVGGTLAFSTVGPIVQQTGAIGAVRQSASTLNMVLPVEGVTVGSPSMDVEGRLGGLLNRAGTQVTVNGQVAEVFPSSTGQGTFMFSNLELTPGLNTVSILAVPPSGLPVQESRNINFVPTTSVNVVVANGRAYAARGTQGLAVMNLRTRESQSFTTLLARVDDVAIADGFLFLLDGQSGGRLAVANLTNPDQPVLVSGPVVVPVSPFAGVSAGGGRVVVSGGTSLLTVRSYDSAGNLSASVGTIDLGIGQPDVLVSEDGLRAFVSTDFSGSIGGAGFGISTIALNAPPASPTLLSRTGLPGSGFTSGAQGPANFPIESAVVNGTLITAHGGGLSRISSTGALLGTTPLGFAAINVDAVGDQVFVVGSGRRLSSLTLGTGTAPLISSTESFPGSGNFTGVSADEVYVAIASNSGGLRILSR